MFDGITPAGWHFKRVRRYLIQAAEEQARQQGTSCANWADRIKNEGGFDMVVDIFRGARVRGGEDLWKFIDQMLSEHCQFSDNRTKHAPTMLACAISSLDETYRSCVLLGLAETMLAPIRGIQSLGAGTIFVQVIWLEKNRRAAQFIIQTVTQRIRWRNDDERMMWAYEYQDAEGALLQSLPPGLRSQRFRLL